MERKRCKEKIVKYTGNNKEKGSITVEAAIVMPFFICLMVSFLFFIRIVFTLEVIQQSIDEAARDLAVSGYIFRESGLEEKLADFSKEITVPQFQDFISILENISLLDSEENGRLPEYADILKNPGHYLVERGKTSIVVPFVRLCLENRIREIYGISDLEKGLKFLGIRDGLYGFDFSGSSYMENGTEDIVITARYRIHLPLPVRILPDMVVVQKACCRAWCGDGSFEDGREENVWTLDYRFERNKRLKEILGSDFVNSKDRIFSFRGGKLVFMHSLDLTLKSYSQPEYVMEKIIEHIDYLAGFRGGIMGQGEEAITIREEEVSEKELLLIIPRNRISDEVSVVLSSCADYASMRGVRLNIKKYGYKNTSEIMEESAGEE